MRANHMLAAAAALTFCTTAALTGARAETPAEFFSGKTVKIIIGFSPAGTYGQYAQLAARHIKK
ncbi:MAG: hypothetical protein AB7J19_07995, partial [Beijerinckiaceae bacterium]